MWETSFSGSFVYLHIGPWAYLNIFQRGIEKRNVEHTVSWRHHEANDEASNKKIKTWNRCPCRPCVFTLWMGWKCLCGQQINFYTCSASFLAIPLATLFRCGSWWSNASIKDIRARTPPSPTNTIMCRLFPGRWMRFLWPAYGSLMVREPLKVLYRVNVSVKVKQ